MNFLHRCITTIVLLGSPLLLISCGQDDTQHIVVYVSADNHLARQVFERFEEQTGIIVDMVGDTEATKSTGLAQRLRAEMDNPQADVFWSSECFLTIQLAQDNVLQPVESSITKDWPAKYKDPNNQWFGFGLRARVLVYSTERVSPNELPETWMDLRDDHWRDRIVMADPRFGTTRGHMGAMKAWWDTHVLPGAYRAFLENLAYNKIKLLTTGNSGVVLAVASGEADIGFTDTDDVWAAQRNGLKVDLIYPSHGEPGFPSEGTLLIPNTVSIIKGAPNPDSARLFLEFMLSEEIERMLAESDSHNIPIHTSLQDEFSQYIVDQPLDVDLKRASQLMNEAVNEAMEVLSNQ